jgi:hypothetical protein
MSAMNDQHTVFVCDRCCAVFGEDDLHDIGDGRNLCGACYDIELDVVWVLKDADAERPVGG